ncbi:carbonic anhydrase-like [Daktulosphaira vitifoliae]|uniref:carbonic anhydrase-like n=1 Tax=Daktulosphaira vitifoliae TaxID=58002 RepID=UPI0021A999DD|nr:carbonic anhydrase-like [Daktulosphaira vitifoliae]
MLAKLVYIFGIVGLVCGSTTANSDEDKSFGYDSGELDPPHWASKYETCSGKYQSPIDIDENLVTNVTLPLLRFHNIDTLPTATTVTNNGHTVVLQLNYTSPIMIGGGPLTPIYKFIQLHFHWGVNDSFGSEDLINNHSYPMELHMVFWNTDYPSYDVATTKSDGLVVLASFFEIREKDNPVYAEIVEALSRIRNPDQTTELPVGNTIRSMLPESTELYFTYKGSLTTPPCLEVVQWIDFKQPIWLSHNQIQAFRMLRSKHGQLTHNARPVQELSGRPIWYNVGEFSMLNGPKQKDSNSSLKVKETSALLFLNIIALFHRQLFF